MNEVTIYQDAGSPYKIDISQHQVEDTSRHLKSSLPEALKNLAVGIVIVIIASVILYLIGDKIDNAMADSILKTVILTVFACMILGLAYALIVQNFKSLVTSLFKPNLKTPEKAIKSFLSVLEKGLYKRAYNLLSDNAQRLDKIDFTVETKMQEDMPDVYFHSLETFEGFWSKLPFSWETDLIPAPHAKITDDSYAFVDVKIMPSSINTDKYAFVAEFVLIKKDDYWFICNGFLWPFSE